MDEMANVSDIGAWREILVHSGAELGGRVAGFLPHLAAALAIILVGWAISRAIELATGRALRTIGLDRAAARVQLAEVLERSDIHLTASQIVARGIFWLLMLTAFLSAVETLGLTAVTTTIDRLIAYIPNLIGAALIVLLGVVGARVLGGVVRSAAVAADLGNASRLGVAAHWIVVGLVSTVALEQLGVATEILVVPLTAIVAALTLSAGFAFALGAVPIVTHILAGHFLRQSLPREGLIVVEGEEGMIEQIGITETRLRSASRSWTIPNSRLLDGVVTLG